MTIISIFEGVLIFSNVGFPLASDLDRSTMCLAAKNVFGKLKQIGCKEVSPKLKSPVQKDY